MHPCDFHLRNCSVQFIRHNQFLQAVKHIITFSFRFFDMFFAYNIIETSFFFILEKKITNPFCRPLVLIKTPEPPPSFKNPPSPEPYYSSLINDRLYKLITNFIWTDPAWFILVLEVRIYFLSLAASAPTGIVVLKLFHFDFYFCMESWLMAILAKLNKPVPT